MSTLHGETGLTVHNMFGLDIVEDRRRSATILQRPVCATPEQGPSIAASGPWWNSEGQASGCVGAQCTISGSCSILIVDSVGKLRTLVCSENR